MHKLFFFLTIILWPSHSFAGVDIWFAPRNDNFLLNQGNYKLWSGVRKKINVYKFYHQQIIQDKQTDLCSKLNFLRSNGIKIAVEWPIMNFLPSGLGHGVEGFADHETTVKLVNRIKSCNVNLDFVAMDEPLYWGVVVNKKNTPGFDVTQLARNVSNNVDFIIKNFPAAQFGDIEPIDQLGDNYRRLIMDWISEFQLVTGSHMYFIHDDVIWADDWMKSSQQVRFALKANDTRFGLIFNAKNGRGPDSVWMESNRGNVISFFTNKENVIDDAIFQSWNHYPNNIDNESDKDSHISIIDFFLKLEKL
ncbi:hypothetical protein [Klebsiella quasipneumoniae]|uniref:hypothetical protein n=1 Tax=Klebsiella quasipneumoniae TaxID=1463165 RepID=UPI0034D55B27